MKTIALDFDGVIHAYTKGWQDGSIYDEPIEGAFDFIKSLFDQGYTVFIFSTRSPRQIKRWIEPKIKRTEYEVIGLGGDMEYVDLIYGFDLEIIPWWKFWVKFWNKKNVLGITQKKFAAHVYIDDRALKFKGDFNDTLSSIATFKTWQAKK